METVRQKNHVDYLNSYSDDDPLAATLIFSFLFLQAFVTNAAPKYPPNNC